MNHRSTGDILKRTGYNIAQWTWGLPQTLLGAVFYLSYRKNRHFDYNGARVTAWNRNDGMSLGKFIFVPRASAHGRTKSVHMDPVSGIKVDRFILTHEYGHTIQSLLLGPAYLLLVGTPSLIWNKLPYFDHKRKESGKSYYSVVFESSANRLGQRTADKKNR